jgi:hypothetical protein
MTGGKIEHWRKKWEPDFRGWHWGKKGACARIPAKWDRFAEKDRAKINI